MKLIKSASPLDDGGWLVDGRWEPDDLELMQIPVCLSDPLRVVDPTGCFFYLPQSAFALNSTLFLDN